MPTANRRAFIRKRAREGFEAGRSASGSEAEALVLYAETQLENVGVQRRLLTDLANSGNLKGPKD
jgi:hypothetical protein